jgi:hypothetical protein
MTGMDSDKDVLGFLEQVWFPEFEPTDEGVAAKIDTGADSGALHCDYQQLITIEETGEEILEFQPLGREGVMVRTAQFKPILVRSSNGEMERRFRITTKIRLHDTVYPIELTLTDRSEMNYEVIIGRKFLDGRFLVDVSQDNSYGEAEPLK